MAKAHWVGDDLYWLLNLSLSELIARYPQYNEATLKGKRAYWRRKIELGETTMPPRPEKQPQDDSNFGEILRFHNMPTELAQEFRDQGFHIGFIKNKDGDYQFDHIMIRNGVAQYNGKEYRGDD